MLIALLAAAAAGATHRLTRCRVESCCWHASTHHRTHLCGHSSCCSNPDVVDTCKRMSSQPCDAIAAELAKAAVAKGRCAPCVACG